MFRTAGRLDGGLAHAGGAGQGKTSRMLVFSVNLEIVRQPEEEAVVRQA